jgi:hypothetical protein
MDGWNSGWGEAGRRKRRDVRVELCLIYYFGVLTRERAEEGGRREGEEEMGGEAWLTVEGGWDGRNEMFC